MSSVFVFDSKGVVVDTLEIHDNLVFLDGRVSKGDRHFYKGVGNQYHGQYLTPPYDIETYDKVYTHSTFYMGDYVQNREFRDKQGIFLEKYQPQFDDLIGTCGVKELSIIENSEFFERSSVVVQDVVQWNKEYNQYYFIVDYRCGRVKYLHDPNPKDLYDLLEYMIRTDWNFIWDKNSITDITSKGLVSDVGDIFQSTETDSKIGTVYSILYSLSKISDVEYQNFVKYAFLESKDGMSLIYNVIDLLSRFGVDMLPYMTSNRYGTYKNVVVNHLITGRNCGHCCYVGFGESIKEEYVRQTKKLYKISD